MPEDRWAKVKEFVAEWFEPLGEGDGYSEEEIAAAEVRLGIRLPEALREFYALAGNRDSLIRKYNRMLTLKEIFFSRDRKYLYFWKENRDILYFGVRIDETHENDPIVYWFFGSEEASSEFSLYRFSEIAMLVIAWEFFKVGKFMAIGTSNSDYSQTIQHNRTQEISILLSKMGIFKINESVIEFTGDGDIAVSSPDLPSFIKLMKSISETSWHFISTEEDGTYYFGENDKECINIMQNWKASKNALPE